MHTSLLEASEQESSPVIQLQDAAVRGPRGPVFGPLTLSTADTITVVCGARGSGRTALLLTLAGRMRLTAGSAHVMGASRPADMRTRVGIVGFDDIDGLEPTATVAATLRERLAWVAPWYRRVPRLTPDVVRELLADAFGELEQPDPDTLARDLGPVDTILIRIALALLESPELLVLDDFDELRSNAERQLVADRLTALATTGTRIVIATTDAADVERFAGQSPMLIEL